MQKAELVEKDISEITWHQIVWLMTKLSGIEHPTIDSRYLQDDKGIIIGVESFVISNFYGWENFETFSDRELSFSWDRDVAIATTKSGHVGRDFSMLYAGYRACLFEDLHPQTKVLVPTILGEKPV